MPSNPRSCRPSGPRDVVRLAVLITVLAAALPAGRAAAAEYMIDTTVDDDTLSACDSEVPSDCSLRGALIKANALPDAEETTIYLLEGEYVLTDQTNCFFSTTQSGGHLVPTTALCVAGRIRLVGDPGGETVIDGNLNHRVMLVGNDAPVTIEGITVRRGRHLVAGLFGGGGGINNAGDLTLIDCAVRGNTTNSTGGGIFNSGTLRLVRTTIAGNTSVNTGGGIQSDSNVAQTSVTIVDSEIRDNTSLDSIGGGIFNYGGLMTISGSTVAGNQARISGGGGIGNAYSGFPPTLKITNSTISGNHAGWAFGGGLWNMSFATAHLRNVTVTGNRSENPDATRGVAGGIANTEGSVLTLGNTIVAGNTAPEIAPDCYDGGRASTIGSDGYNIIGTQGGLDGLGGTECDLSGGASGDQIGGDPALQSLGDNGGATDTHGLGSESDAIDAGNPAGCKDADGNTLASDQRGEPRPEDGDGDGQARCDVGAVEGGGALGVDEIDPPHAGNGGTVCALVHGSHFVEGATVALVRSGEDPIPGMMSNVDDETRSVIATGFDLRGTAPGAWDVVVTNPDGSSATLEDGFTVDEGGSPHVWAEIIGPSTVRVGRAMRYFFFYGNRGNVDALGVPFQIAVPPGVALDLRFAVAPPPDHPGRVIDDWSTIPLTFHQPLVTDYEIASFVLPVIPAGFTGSLEFRITVSPSVTAPFVLIPVISHPYALPDGPDADADPDVDPAFVQPLVASALDYAERAFDFAEPLDEEALAEHTTDLLERIVSQGTAAWIDTGGRGSGAGEGGGGGAGGSEGATGEPGAPVCYEQCVPKETTFETATEQGLPVPPLPPVGTDSPCQGDCSAPGCRAGRSWPGGRMCSCPPPPTDPLRPFDPNDKFGPSMGGPYISGEEPLRYTILFENDPELATAAAQDVVVTDQLDTASLDLSTFSLGPISFGEEQVFPIPGVKEFTTDVDLRPENDLIVRVTAGLDVLTGIVTWRFASLDPDTMEPPEDPLAGFLPPNVNPPEGDGSVSFTIAYKPEMPSGTEICNHADIVFDVNPPIITPEWCNVLDNDAPESAVQALAALQTTADFDVAWAGSDLGGGIANYEVFVSEEGGPPTRFVSEMGAGSATFHGEPGRTYSFYSTSIDKALNAEAAPLAPDAVTTVDLCPDDAAKVAPGTCGCGVADTDSDEDGIPDCDDGESVHDLAVVGIAATKTATLSDGPARARTVKVQIQNRSPHVATIPDASTLEALVALEVESLAVPACAPAPSIALRAPAADRFPITLKPKRKLKVLFDVVIACANDPAKGAGHEDYRLRAEVDHGALGASDSHPADDVCPRQVAPPGVVDPHPDGSIVDKGCGAKLADKTFGGPVRIDAVRKAPRGSRLVGADGVAARSR